MSDNLLDEYAVYLKMKKLKSIDTYISSISDFLRYLDDNGIVYLSVNIRIAEGYRTKLLTGERKLSRATVNNILSRLKSFYVFLVKRRLCRINPFSNIKSLKGNKSLPKDILSVQEMGILLDSFSVVTRNDIMIKTVIEILYGGALRISEADNLLIEDIDFNTGKIRIVESKTDNIRYTYFGEVVLESIVSYMKLYGISSGRLFPKHQKTTMRCLVNRKLKKECERHRFKVITSHSFRHSVATHLLRSGAGIREVQEFLGHKRIRNTQVYTRLVNQDLKDMIHEFHPREV